MEFLMAHTTELEGLVESKRGHSSSTIQSQENIRSEYSASGICECVGDEKKRE